MQSSVAGNDPSLVLLQKPESGVDFEAARMTRRRLKQVEAAKLYAEAKANEANQKTKELTPLKPKVTTEIIDRYNPCAACSKQELSTLAAYVKSLPGWPTRDANSTLEWYYDFRTPSVWLQDTHIDGGIDLMRLRQKEHPEWFRSRRLCFVDTILGRLWRADYDQWKKSGGSMLPSGLYDYFTGKLPTYEADERVWKVQIDEIYTALHVNGNHWVAALINIPRRHVTIWDSILGPLSASNIAVAVQPIVEIFPYGLRQLAPAEEKEDIELTPFEYTIIPKESGIPQNLRVGDCGVYCLKYIEFHSLGLPFPAYLCDKNIKHIRDRLAYDVYTRLGRTGMEKREEFALLETYVGK